MQYVVLFTNDDEAAMKIIGPFPNREAAVDYTNQVAPALNEFDDLEVIELTPAA